MKSTLRALSVLAAFILLYSTGIGQANTALSNLVSPTAVNQSIVPNSNNNFNLGSSTYNWRYLYMGTAYYLKNLRILHAPGATNFFAGPSAGNAATTGLSNTSLGDNTLIFVSSGGYNTALGFTALRGTTTGSRNTASGYTALYNNTGGSFNTASGDRVLYVNTTGSYNTASGSTTMFFNTTGTNNSAFGNASLYKNTTGAFNVAVGNEALYENTTGAHNVVIGNGAMHDNTTGGYQVAIGNDALYNLNGGGGNNVATGHEAMYETTTGNYNTAAGNESMYDNTTGSFNAAVGYSALSYNTTSGNNTAMGAYTMYSNGGAGYNTAVGVYAGYYTSTNSTFVGWFARGVQAGVTNSTAIGYNTVVTASNQVRIGTNTITSIGGQVGWTTLSDGRFKKEVKENVPGLTFINQLRPVTYNVDASAFSTAIESVSARTSNQHETSVSVEERNAIAEKSKIVYTGFIAQEVEAVAKKMNYDFSGIDAPKNDKDYYGLRYSDFVVPLVKAVQQLSQKNDSLVAETEKLKTQNLEQALVFEERLQKIEAALKLRSTPVLSLSDASLGQNTPNPFRGNTVVNYKISQGISNAQIAVYDAAGKMLKQYTIAANENGTLRIDAATLPSGTYHYALFVDGKIIDTKKMILIK
ncbi:MAG: tail fiber domain-containing protein [Agriterribacter sp.]